MLTFVSDQCWFGRDRPRRLLRLPAAPHSSTNPMVRSLIQQKAAPPPQITRQCAVARADGEPRFFPSLQEFALTFQQFHTLEMERQGQFCLQNVDSVSTYDSPWVKA